MSEKKHISLLFIGNSITYDSIAYWPKIIMSNGEFTERFRLSVKFLYVASGRPEWFCKLFDTSLMVSKLKEVGAYKKEEPKFPVVLYSFDTENHSDKWIQDRNFNGTISGLVSSEQFDFIVFNRHSGNKCLFNLDTEIQSIEYIVKRIRSSSCAKICFIDSQGRSDKNISPGLYQVGDNPYKNFIVDTVDDMERVLDEHILAFKKIHSFKFINTRQALHFLNTLIKNKWNWRRDYLHLGRGACVFYVNVFVLKELIPEFNIDAITCNIDVDKYKTEMEDDPTISINDKNRHIYLDAARRFIKSNSYGKCH